MKKIAFLIFVATTTAACDGSINQLGLKQAQEFCSKNDGVFSLEHNPTEIYMGVACKNGAYRNVKASQKVK